MRYVSTTRATHTLTSSPRQSVADEAEKLEKERQGWKGHHIPYTKVETARNKEELESTALLDLHASDGKNGE